MRLSAKFVFAALLPLLSIQLVYALLEINEIKQLVDHTCRYVVEGGKIVDKGELIGNRYALEMERVHVPGYDRWPYIFKYKPKLGQTVHVKLRVDTDADTFQINLMDNPANHNSNDKIVFHLRAQLGDDEIWLNAKDGSWIDHQTHRSIPLPKGKIADIRIRYMGNYWLVHINNLPSIRFNNLVPVHHIKYLNVAGAVDLLEARAFGYLHKQPFQIDEIKFYKGRTFFMRAQSTTNKRFTVNMNERKLGPMVYGPYIGEYYFGGNVEFDMYFTNPVDGDLEIKMSDGKVYLTKPRAGRQEFIDLAIKGDDIEVLALEFCDDVMTDSE